MRDIRVLIPSDTHIGSEVGLCSPEIILNKNTPRESIRYYNEVQAEIYDGFMSIMKEIGKVDVVVFNGDIVDGYNDKAHGLGEWSCCYDDQINEAVRLFKPYMPKAVYGTIGSTYHVGDNICGDMEVVKELQGIFKEDHFLDIAGVRFHFAHKIGVSKNTRTKSNAVMAELAEAISNRDSYGDVDVIVRSHAHYYTSAAYDNRTAIVTPALKARDDFVKRLGLAYAPRLGMVYVDCNNGDYNIEPVLFKLSQKNYAEWIKVDV